MPSIPPLLHRFLYISRLSSGSPPHTVSQILRQSRERNRARAIGGALVFDGERFCQLLEGEPAAVVQLAARITADPRHQDVQVLADEAAATPRLFVQWQSGYGDPDVLDAVDPANAGAATAAATVAGQPLIEWRIAAFIRLLGDCDMSS